MTGMGYGLSDAQRVQMLRKLMLFWDGQWFLKTVETFGLEPAIDINARVRASFGRIEMRTMLKVLHKRQADDLADALHLLVTYVQAFMGEGLSATFVPTGADHAEITVRRCTAYEGAKRADLPRADQACVACELVWNAWLETLLPGARVDVQYPLRQGRGDPHCLFLVQIHSQGGEPCQPNPLHRP